MNKPSENAMANKVKSEREALGWSQAKLAEAAGTTQQTVDRIERGLTAHSRAVPKIIEAFGKEWYARSRTIDRIKGTLAKTRSYNSPVPTKEHSFPVLSLSSDGTVDLLQYSQISLALVDTAASYALMVGSEALQPNFQTGDLLYVSLEQKPVLGGFVVAFQLDPEPTHGATLPLVEVFKLISETDTQYISETISGEPHALDKALWHIDPIVSRYTTLPGGEINSPTRC